jgi:hypothetical protein
MGVIFAQTRQAGRLQANKDSVSTALAGPFFFVQLQKVSCLFESVGFVIDDHFVVPGIVGDVMNTVNVMSFSPQRVYQKIDIYHGVFRVTPP